MGAIGLGLGLSLAQRPGLAATPAAPPPFPPALAIEAGGRMLLQDGSLLLLE